MSAKEVYDARGFGGRQGAGERSAVVVGASTSGCVRATAVDALQHGYRVLVPREAVADRAEDADNASLLDIDAKYGDVISISEALAAVGAAHALPPGG